MNFLVILLSSGVTVSSLAYIMDQPADRVAILCIGLLERLIKRNELNILHLASVYKVYICLHNFNYHCIFTFSSVMEVCFWKAPTENLNFLNQMVHSLLQETSTK